MLHDTPGTFKGFNNFFQTPCSRWCFAVVFLEYTLKKKSMKLLIVTLPTKFSVVLFCLIYEEASVHMCSQATELAYTIHLGQTTDDFYKIRFQISR